MIRSNSLTSAQRALFVLQVLAIIGFFALACGCSSGSSKKRSKLSEAAAEAEKEPAQRETQKRKEKKKDEDTPTLYVPEEEDDDDGGFDDVMVGVVLTDDPEPQPVAQQDSGVDFLHFGLLIGGGTLAGSDYDGFALIGLQFGVYNPKLRVGADIAVLGMPMNITEAAAGVGGLTNEGEFAVELSVRRYLTPDRSDLGVYITGGFRFGVLIWDYENPIEVDVGGTTETIQSDFLKTYGTKPRTGHFDWKR